MKPFDYYGLASILHLNARKEGPDENKVLAVDVKLQITVQSSDLSAFDDQIREFIYTDIGAVRNVMMGPIPFLHELENCEAIVGGLQYDGAKLKKFVVQPKDGDLAEITFQVSLRPNGNDVALLAEHLQDQVKVSFRPQSGDLLAEQ